MTKMWSRYVDGCSVIGCFELSHRIRSQIAGIEGIGVDVVNML